VRPGRTAGQRGRVRQSGAMDGPNCGVAPLRHARSTTRDACCPQATDNGHVTRAVGVVLDPSPSQERWLRSYAGSMRAAYTWALAEVRDNLAVRADERDRGVPADELTPALSWTAFSIAKRWRAARDNIHPWHRDVSIHAFRTRLDNAANALKNYSESRSGKRRGAKVGFPTFKNRPPGRRSPSSSSPTGSTTTTGSTPTATNMSG